MPLWAWSHVRNNVSKLLNHYNEKIIDLRYETLHSQEFPKPLSLGTLHKQKPTISNHKNPHAHVHIARSQTPLKVKPNESINHTLHKQANEMQYIKHVTYER